jgi:type II secretory ATPase GspE/PulE/Tfp pilus assembly ATPase PilB-like protein
MVNGGVKPEELKNEPKETNVNFGDDYAEEMKDITNRFNFRLQLMQTPKRGRTAVARILDKESAKKDLDSLGYEEGMVNKLKYYSELPDGLFIVTGPTGSGKSTTLFAMINQIDPIERSIQTMENPIEYSHGGWYQYEAGKGNGTTESDEFKKILKGMLRNDPDVLLVGEIRDAEVAYIATQAANTGHFVFATLHANSSIKAISRLAQIGADMSALSTVLRGILAQRLVRKLCSCKVEDHSDAHHDLVREITGSTHVIYKANGCDLCGYTGYRGRVAIQELLDVNKEVRLAIEHGKTVSEIEEKFMPKEKTLWGAGIKLVSCGVTSIDEVKRVAVEDH